LTKARRTDLAHAVALAEKMGCRHPVRFVSGDEVTCPVLGGDEARGRCQSSTSSREGSTTTRTNYFTDTTGTVLQPARRRSDSAARAAGAFACSAAGAGRAPT
jgi:hypothetical protein